MTNSPADLLTVRQHVMAVTGLTDPADVGIVGDGAHSRVGGYHEGRDVLSTLGVLNTDYSVAEYARDRNGLTNSASALDIALAWPNGGRVAAIRFSNLIVADLLAGTPGTEVLRGINYSPDGQLKLRRDKRWNLVEEASGDSVDIHTHFEFWRDTEGRRHQAFLDLLLRRIRQAINGNDSPPVSAPPMEDDMLIIVPKAVALKADGSWVDKGNAIPVPLFEVGHGPAGWGDAWIKLAANGPATIRVVTDGGGWSGKTVTLDFAGSALVPLPQGTGLAYVGRVDGDPLTADVNAVIRYAPK